MKTATFLVALMITACGAEFPSNTIVEAPPHVEEALIVIHDLLEQETGQTLPPINETITWMEGDCLEDISWNTDDYCYAGLFDTFNGIFVLRRDPLSSTVLVHEVIHYMINEVYNKNDVGHHRIEWWELQGPGEQALREVGL